MYNRSTKWLLALALAAGLGIPAAAHAADRGDARAMVPAGGEHGFQQAGYRDRDDRHPGRGHARGHRKHRHYDRHRGRHKHRHHWRGHHRRPAVIYRHHGHRHHRHGGHRPHGRFELHFNLGGRH